MTTDDIATGEAALVAYVKKEEGWMAAFVPEYAERQGAQTVIQIWDAGGPAKDPGEEAQRRAKAGAALYNAIIAAGYGSRVTAQECNAAANEVITAVVERRTALAKKLKLARRS